ncbi:MAG TPA: hypothetical protein PJ994_09205, partial [Tepidiformaceae bacterium]|nr:hypothetical protein [Tepidiformaceae bacterium]
DHLVHAIVHGSRWDPIPPLRWIADATLLLRRHTIRWDLVVSEAERRGVTLAVGAGLAFLREHFEAPIPEEPPRQLLERGHGVLERADFRFQQGGRGAAAQSARYVTRYLRLTRGKSPVVRLNLFPAYLRAMWGLESAWGLPREGTRRFVDRARGREPLPRVRPIPE